LLTALLVTGSGAKATCCTDNLTDLIAGGEQPIKKMSTTIKMKIRPFI